MSAARDAAPVTRSVDAVVAVLRPNHAESSSSAVPSQCKKISDLWSYGEIRNAEDHEIMSNLIYFLTRAIPRWGKTRGNYFYSCICCCRPRGRAKRNAFVIQRLLCALLGVVVLARVRFFLFALCVWIWWEYIPSKSNRADAISRLGARNPGHRQRGFTGLPPSAIIGARWEVLPIGERHHCRSTQVGFRFRSTLGFPDPEVREKELMRAST